MSIQIFVEVEKHRPDGSSKGEMLSFLKSEVEIQGQQENPDSLGNSFTTH
jgi:hypothetical protein